MSGRFPRWAARAVQRLVVDDVTRAGLLADLEERYLRREAGAARTGWLVLEIATVVLNYLGRGSRRTPDPTTEQRMTLDSLRLDLRYALRGLVRRPAFALLVTGTLALGIGANTAIFSVVDGLLIEPLPYAAADRLVLVNQRSDQGFTASISFPNFRDWRERTSAFSDFALFYPASLTFGSDLGAEVVEAAWVGRGYFETLGVPPALGRVFDVEESEPPSDPVVVLSHAFWVDRLGADPSAIGRDIRLSDEPFTVVGVMPADFAPRAGTTMWLPIGYIRDRIAGAWQDRYTGIGTEAFGRLADGFTLEEAQADLVRVADELRAVEGRDPGTANLVPLREAYLGDTGRQLLLMMGAVGLVLLVACANVANLFMVRSESRRSEMAVRGALGAGRGRLARQLLTESVVFGLAAGVAGVVLGRLGLSALLAAVGETLPPGAAGRMGIDAPVLAFTAAVSLSTALVAGLIPALRRARGGAEELHAGARSVGRGGRARATLMALEMALSFMLVVGAGLLIESLSNLRAADRGFDGSDVLTLRVRAPADVGATREAWYAFQSELMDAVGAVPGVATATQSNIFPLAGNSWEMLYRDELTPPDDRGESVLMTMATPSYFDAFGIEIVNGRPFGPGDRWGGELVAIVDETLAEARWPGQDPIGRRITFETLPTGEGDAREPVWRTVIGVARHVRHYELATPSRIEVYTPLEQSAAWGFTSYLSVRAEGDDPGSLLPGVRAAIAGVDPDIALYRIRTMNEIIRTELGVHRALRELFSVFAGITLILGAIGIYGVVSHSTALRVREMGLRLALGGDPTRLVGLLVRDAMGPVVIGLLLGAFGSVGLARLLEAFLYEVGAVEWAVLAPAFALMLAVALLSAWGPARAAARIHPTEALRADGA